MVDAGREAIRADGLGIIESRAVPGEGMTIYLRGALDARQAGELEQTLEDAHRAHPPVTVDLSEALSIDGPIVDVLGAASGSFAEGLRVIGALGSRPVSFELAHIEHLQAT